MIAGMQATPEQPLNPSAASRLRVKGAPDAAVPAGDAPIPSAERRYFARKRAKRASTTGVHPYTPGVSVRPSTPVLAQ